MPSCVRVAVRMGDNSQRVTATRASPSFVLLSADGNRMMRRRKAGLDQRGSHLIEASRRDHLRQESLTN